jgi:NAD-dependent SIR2 family protein deacetylase
MRCQACNKLLNDFESTRKDKHGYIDLCNKCYSPEAADFNEEGDSPILEEDDMDGADYAGCSEVNYKDDQ